eukprot:130806-Chlamydomonas_euryale.AAC.16
MGSGSSSPSSAASRLLFPEPTSPAMPSSSPGRTVSATPDSVGPRNTGSSDDGPREPDGGGRSAGSDWWGSCGCCAAAVFLGPRPDRASIADACAVAAAATA